MRYARRTRCAVAYGTHGLIYVTSYLTCVAYVTSYVTQASGLMPSGARLPTLKDVAIGLALVLQIGWFLLSLTDPMARPGQTPLLNAALTSGGEMVDRMEAKRAAESAEYAAMLQVRHRSASLRCASRFP